MRKLWVRSKGPQSFCLTRRSDGRYLDIAMNLSNQSAVTKALPDGTSSRLMHRRPRYLEWLAEKSILAVSLSAILVIFLIFIFVGREAWPVFCGRVNTAHIGQVLTAAQVATTKPEELARYLGVTAAELKGFDAETVKTLVQLKAEELAQIDNPNARINSAEWSKMLQPYPWRGYSEPSYIWQPVSEIPKFNIVPLFLGSLKVTLMALLFAIPLGVGATIYVSQLASPRVREFAKPVIELLAGIPSVVLGFFALLVMASVLQSVFGYTSRLNTFVAGIALGLSVIPVVFTISEDALTSVPRTYMLAGLALGASPSQVAWQVVLPAALPGVFAACVLGFGRAIGETMIVLMASGNASIVSGSIFDSCRTITATIAAELAEVVFGGPHYRILFMLGTLLFAVTFMANFAGDLFVHRLRARLEGRA